jgi:trk/ktr system potassium uptake protein
VEIILEAILRVVVVGAGGVGIELARILARRKENEVVVVESSEERAREISGEIDALVLHGDGAHPEILAKARLTDADALVAVTGSDAINTVIGMLGHRASVGRIVVKLDDVGLRAALQEIGVTDIVAPRLAAAAHIASVLYGFHRLDLSLMARGGLELVDIPSGRATGKKIEDLEPVEGALLIAVSRGQEILLARGAAKIEPGDVLLVLVEGSGAAAQFRANLNDENEKE